MGKYPESERLRESSVAILRAFMEWLTEEREQPFEMAYLEQGCKYLTPANARSEDLILEFLEIDPKKLDNERRQMLEDMRS
jgi:hypothetical protein